MSWDETRGEYAQGLVCWLCGQPRRSDRRVFCSDECREVHLIQWGLQRMGERP